MLFRSYANGAPNLTTDTPALLDLARERGVPICGKDFKTGQTFMKTVLAPAFKARMLGVATDLARSESSDSRRRAANTHDNGRTRGFGPGDFHGALSDRYARHKQEKQLNTIYSVNCKKWSNCFSDN